MDAVFSIEESLKFGWQKTKEHSTLLFQIMLTFFALQIMNAIVQHSLEHTFIGGGASLILSVAGIVLGIGFLNIALKISRGETAYYPDLVPPMMLAWNVFLVSLVTGIVVFIGLVLLIVPGIYFALRLSMARFAVLDGATVMESLEKSTEETMGQKWQLLLFFFIMIVLNILGVIPFGLGLLVTIPITTIAYAHVYNKLKTHTAHHHEHAHEGHEHHEHHHEHSDNA